MPTTAFPLFLSLLLAFVAAQFPLQSEWMSSRKKSRFARAYLAHGAVHFGLATTAVWAFTQVSLLAPRSWVVVLALVSVYLLVDLALSRFPEGLWSFLLDLTLRVFLIGAATFALAAPPYDDLQRFIEWFVTVREKILFTSTVYVTVIFAGGYLIRHLVRQRFRQGALFETDEGVEARGAAGMYIGWVERFLVLTALLCRSPEAVGLILAAKSIARFPELKKEQNAEYFLLGTLLSLGLALAGGLILYRLLYGTISLK
jgi:hypothetical protein